MWWNRIKLDPVHQHLWYMSSIYAIEWCVKTNLWPFFDLQDMTQSWPTQQAFRGKQTLFTADAKLPSTQKQSMFSSAERIFLIWGLLPGISRRFSCRSGRSSAANVKSPSPGTPQVVSLTRGNTISPRSWNPNRRWGRVDNISHTCCLFSSWQLFLKLAADHSTSRAAAGGEGCQRRQRERESGFQAVQHRVRSEVRKHLWTPSAERLMRSWVLPLFNVNLLFCSLSLYSLFRLK